MFDSFLYACLWFPGQPCLHEQHGMAKIPLMASLISLSSKKEQTQLNKAGAFCLQSPD